MSKCIKAQENQRVQEGHHCTTPAPFPSGCPGQATFDVLSRLFSFRQYEGDSPLVEGRGHSVKAGPEAGPR